MDPPTPFDRHAVLAVYDEEERRRSVIADPAYEVAWDGDVLRITGPGPEPWANGIVYSSLGPETADGTIARQVEHFRALGHAFEWKLFEHDGPADLAGRLARAGFVPAAVETLVAFDVEWPFAARSLPAGVEIVELEDPSEFDCIAQQNFAANGDRTHADWLAASLVAEKTAAPGRLSVFVARVADSVVSSGWIRFPEASSFASLWGGSTHPQWRRRGIYTALVARRLDLARRRGSRRLTVDCSAQSLPILVRRGFRVLTTTTPWIWRP